MSYVNLDQLPAFINEYALTRLMPNAPSLMQFVIGGVLGSIQTKIPSLVAKYEQPAKMLNLLNDKNQINVEGVRTFLANGFNKANKVTIAGFTLDREEGEALVQILEAHKAEG